MEQIKHLYKIMPLHFPVDGNLYNVQKWISTDGGMLYAYAGFGRFCKTIDECCAWIKEQENEGGTQDEYRV